MTAKAAENKAAANSPQKGKKRNSTTSPEEPVAKSGRTLRSAEERKPVIRADQVDLDAELEEEPAKEAEIQKLEDPGTAVDPDFAPKDAKACDADNDVVEMAADEQQAADAKQDDAAGAELENTAAAEAKELAEDAKATEAKPEGGNVEVQGLKESEPAAAADK